MEGITRLVSESLARHGFDRPLDYRRLRWSRWFRCESLHSLLFVPSKAGVFALAEEIDGFSTSREGRDFSRAEETAKGPAALAAEVGSSDGCNARAQSRLLAVNHFFEDDDMAFVLDRMLSRQNPMRAGLISGRYFVRFVVIEDAAQRRSICNALNQWIAGAGENVSGIGAHFATSLEAIEARVVAGDSPAKQLSSTALQPDSGAVANIRRPSPFPSGF